jgi:hypothetical protein
MSNMQMPKSRTSEPVVAGAALPLPTIMKSSFKGLVRKGMDRTGLFGEAKADLASLPYVIEVFYEANRRGQAPADLPGAAIAGGHVAPPILSAYIRIGDGIARIAADNCMPSQAHADMLALATGRAGSLLRHDAVLLYSLRSQSPLYETATGEQMERMLSLSEMLNLYSGAGYFEILKPDPFDPGHRQVQVFGELLPMDVTVELVKDPLAPVLAAKPTGRQPRSRKPRGVGIARPRRKTRKTDVGKP